MRRQDFIDNVTTWSELIIFCYNEDCDICEDIYSEEARDEDVDNNLVDLARNHTWQELLDILLHDIPTGSDYYYRGDWGDWHEADDDLFEDRKQDVIDWMDDNGYWDDEDDEDEDEEIFDAIDTEFPDDEEDLEPIEPEDISFTDLFTSCSQKLKTIEDTQEQEAQEETENFDSFVMSFTVTEERR